jgi:phosphoserine phosphatase RsbU/P
MKQKRGQLQGIANNAAIALVYFDSFGRTETRRSLSNSGVWFAKHRCNVKAKKQRIQPNSACPAKGKSKVRLSSASQERMPMLETAAGVASAEIKQVPTITIRWPEQTDSANRRLIVMCGGDAEDVLLKDPQSCARHTEIVSQHNQFSVVSRNGQASMSVNGKPVQGKVLLRENDLVAVGNNEIRFHMASPDGSAADVEVPANAPAPERRKVQRPISDRIIHVSDFVEQSRALRVLSHATASLLVHHPFPVIFDRIVDLVFEAVPADYAAVMLLDGEEPVLKGGRDRQGTPTTRWMSRAIMHKVIEGRVAMMVSDVFEEENQLALPRPEAEAGGSVICAPLWMSTRQGYPVRVIGLLYASARRDCPPFREADLEILTVLANTAAAKIETAWLLEAGLEQRRMQNDLRVAAEIQAGLLPHTLASIPGYDLAGRTQSSEAVGGDFYDLAYDGNLLHLALGDVAGKGVGAAMLMVELRSTVRANWQTGALSDAAIRINGHFHLNIPPDRYATFFLGRLSPQSGKVTYVNAGHNRPLLVSADGRCETLDQGGMAFGAFADSSYLEADVSMRPDDTLVIYSDGISDVWPEPGSADRELVQIVRSVGSGGANQIEQAIFAAAERRTPDLARDDRTLVVVRRLGS